MMDCREAQEQILESLECPAPSAGKNELELHLLECAECQRFALLQSDLDRRLHEGIAAPQLSSGFRTGLRARIATRTREPWPDWLPDVAHLAGSGAAIGCCALLLPLPVPVVLGGGIVAAFLAYALQAILVSTLEQEKG